MYMYIIGVYVYVCCRACTCMYGDVVACFFFVVGYLALDVGCWFGCHLLMMGSVPNRKEGCYVIMYISGASTWSGN